MEFALWSRPAVRQLIKRDLGIKLSVRAVGAVGDYLAHWGFTPQKPIKRAYEQRPETVQTWLGDEYPAIPARAKLEGAKIHWGDEPVSGATGVIGVGINPSGGREIAWKPGDSQGKPTFLTPRTVHSGGDREFVPTES